MKDLWWLWALMAVALGVRWIVLAVTRSEAADALEVSMDRGDVEGVRSVLIVRGHLLRKDVREAAKVWLVERDNEKGT